VKRRKGTTKRGFSSALRMPRDEKQQLGKKVTNLEGAASRKNIMALEVTSGASSGKRDCPQEFHGAGHRKKREELVRGGGATK